MIQHVMAATHYCTCSVSFSHVVLDIAVNTTLGGSPVLSDAVCL